jgi:tRNA G46 methylase TrmB
MATSRTISTSQTGPHESLERLVRKHSGTTFAKPIIEHTRFAFEQADAFVRRTGRSIILDSCCGTGESSQWLAQSFPECCVVGIDKSAHRLAKGMAKTDVPHLDRLLQTETDASHLAENATPAHTHKNAALLLRADVIDFWRLAAEAVREGRWMLKRHYLLYPNPYPKPHHIMRRWHGHPVFPTMMRLAEYTELRTNWRIYAEEFAQASRILGYEASLEEWNGELSMKPPITAFERKYTASGHTLYRVLVQASASTYARKYDYIQARI